MAHALGLAGAHDRAQVDAAQHLAEHDAHLELREKGIEPEKPPYRVGGSGSYICFVRDPDGYRIELIERS